MAPKLSHYKARVARKEQLTDRVYEFLLDLEHPKSIAFTPGQFVSVDVGDGMRRQYSISSSPFLKNQVELLVDITPGGPGSKFFDQAKPGGLVTFSEPMGRFNLEKDNGTIVFLASGTGIAPFKSMISYLVEKQDKDQSVRSRSIYLFWSFRYEKDIFLRYYFEALDTRYTNFNFTITLSRAGTDWTGCTGYAQTCVPQPVLANKSAQFYICGGNVMVSGARDFLRKQEIDEDRIHFEPF